MSNSSNSSLDEIKTIGAAIHDAFGDVGFNLAIMAANDRRNIAILNRHKAKLVRIVGELKAVIDDPVKSAPIAARLQRALKLSDDIETRARNMEYIDSDIESE